MNHVVSCMSTFQFWFYKESSLCGDNALTMRHSQEIKQKNVENMHIPQTGAGAKRRETNQQKVHTLLMY